MPVRSPLYRKACALGVVLCLAAAARAQTVITFTPTVSPAWESSANWTPQALPGPGSLATITTSTVGVNATPSVGGINLNGGNIGGNGTLTLTSTAFGSTWTSGMLTQGGTLVIGSGHTLALSGADNKVYTHLGQSSGGHVIRNQGIITWAGGGNLLGGDGGAIINESGATFRATNDQVLGWSNGGNAPSFSNAGLFEKTAGVGATLVSQMTFTNTGTVWAKSGAIRFQPTSTLVSTGGTFTADAGKTIEFAGANTFNNGTFFSGAGINLISGGTTVFDSFVTTNNLVFAGGTANGNALIDGSSLTWTGGSWIGNGIFDFLGGHLLTINGTADKTLTNLSQSTNGRRVGISGGALWEDSGKIIGNDGAGFLVNAGGAFTIRNDSTMQYGGGGAIPFFNNNGTLSKQNATGTTTFDRVDFTNTGTFNLESGQIDFVGTGASFNNSGAINLLTGTTLNLNVSGGTSTGLFGTNFGSQVRLLGGTQTFNGGAQVSGGGSFDILGGTLAVNGPATVGNIGFAPGHMLLDAGGTLGGTGTLTVKAPATFTWQAGTMTNVGTLAIELNAIMEIVGGAGKTITHGGQSSDGHKIVNAGTVTWSGPGAMVAGDGASITNTTTGFFDLQAASSFSQGSGGISSFTNQGTLVKSTSIGTFTFAGGIFTNTASGTIDVQAGTLSLATGGSSAGTLSVQNGAALRFDAPFTIAGGKIIGSGEAQIASSVTFSGNTLVGQGIASGYLKLLSGGTLGGGATVTVSGNNSTLEWNGGSMTSTGVTLIQPGGTLLITGPDLKVFTHGGQSSNGRTIDNFGTILWINTGTGVGVVRGDDGAALNNNIGAIFDVQVPSTLGHVNGNAMTFNNAGTFKKSAGGGVFLYNGGAFNNTGLALAQNGTIRFASGGTSTGGEFQALSGTFIDFTAPYTFTSGTKVTGGGEATITGTTLTIGGGSASVVNGTLTIKPTSTLTGSGTLEVAAGGLLYWEGGSMTGPGITRVLSGGELELFGADLKTLTHGGQSSGGRTLQNAGLVSIYDAGTLRLSDGAAVDNMAGGVFALESIAGIGYSSGNQGSFSNSGTFVKRNSSGKATLASFTFTNQVGGSFASQSGILEVSSTFINEGGTLSASGGATITFTGAKTFNGGSFLGSGDIDVLAGTTALSGTINSSNLNLAGGTFTGIATLIGAAEWSGGTFIGASSLTINGPTDVLQITGSNTKTLTHAGQSSGGSVIDNKGSIFWSGTGSIVLGDGAQIVNRQSFVIQSDATISQGSGSAGSILNQGSFGKVSGGGVSQVDVPFSTSGAVVVSSGTLRFSQAFTPTSGTIFVTNNSNLQFDQGLNLPASASLGGDGSVLGNVTSAGTLTPGALLGSLFINGNLTLLATSNFLAQVGGTFQGVSYDTVYVNGDAAIGGALGLSFANSFQTLVSSGDIFFLLSANTPITGSFANVANGQRVGTLDGFGSFQVNYGVSSAFATNAVVLSNFSTIPEPSTWALLIAGGATVLFLARRRRV